MHSSSILYCYTLVNGGGNATASFLLNTASYLIICSMDLGMKFEVNGFWSENSIQA